MWGATEVNAWRQKAKSSKKWAQVEPEVAHRTACQGFAGQDLKSHSRVFHGAQSTDHRVRTLSKMNFREGSTVKNLPTMQVDTGSIPGMGRTPGEGNSKPCTIVSLPAPLLLATPLPELL